MVEEAKSSSWWKTIPGILTTVTAMVTAVTGLIVALHQVGLLQGAKEPAKAAPQGPIARLGARAQEPILPGIVQRAKEASQAAGPRDPQAPVFPGAMLSSASGSWENIDPASPGITKLKIRKEGLGLYVQAWGKCQPSDCDWGEVKAEPYGAGQKLPGMRAIYRGDDMVTILLESPQMIRVDYESGKSGSKQSFVLRKQDTLRTE